MHPITTKPAILAAILTVLALCAAPAMGQNDPGDLPGARVLSEEALASDRGPFTFTIGGGGLAIFEADFQSADASIATYFARTGVEMSWKAAKTLQLNFGIAYEAGFYEIDGGKEAFPALDENDPFDTMQSVAFAGSGMWFFSDPWYAIGAATATAGWESGADFSEAWTFAGFGGVGYRFTDRFTLALGAGVTSRLEDDPLYYPFISFRWQATDDLLLASEGLGIRLTSTINDHFDVFFRAGYEGRSYRLSDNRDAEPNAALLDSGVYIALGVGWTPIPNFRIGLEGGAVVYRELELRDSSGHRLTEIDTDIAPFLGLNLRYTF